MKLVLKNIIDFLTSRLRIVGERNRLKRKERKRKGNELKEGKGKERKGNEMK